MSLHAEFAADAAELLADIGRPVTFRSATVTALVGDSALSLELQAGGFAQSGQITVKLRSSDYASSPPLDSERITHNGIEYRIDSISARAPSAWFELRCSPLTA